MNYYWMNVLACTIFIPALVGLIRLRKINVMYYPFILLLWIGGVNEVISYFTAKYFQNTAPNTNIYGLLETLLILWQFKRWEGFGRLPKLFPLLVLFVSALWVVENFITDSFYNFNSYFTVSSAVIIVFASIIMVNKILINERKGLLKNPIFIICICFIVSYAYGGIIEILWDYGVQVNDALSINIYNILIFINLFVYIVYSYAILCMRKKLRFTMLL